jgi:hypothetical protein
MFDRIFFLAGENMNDATSKSKYSWGLFEYEFQKKRKPKPSSQFKISKNIATKRNSSLVLGEFSNQDDKNWVW